MDSPLAALRRLPAVKRNLSATAQDDEEEARLPDDECMLDFEVRIHCSLQPAFVNL
jgi:hypothetical protein